MTISLRIGTGPNAGQVVQAYSEVDVLNGIKAGDDVLVNGAPATVGNSGGNWYLNGVLVCMYFGSCPGGPGTTSSSTSSTSSTTSTSTGTTPPSAGGPLGTSEGLGPGLLIIGVLLLLAVD
jgi:hypothetical protein